MTFNIKNTAIAASAKFHVRDAAGELLYTDDGQKVTITVHSPGTKPYQKAKHAREERNNTRVFGRTQGKAEAKMSAEDKVAERAEFLAAITISFDNLDYPDANGRGGFELYKAVYSDIEIGHVAEDLEKFMDERGNFKKPSAPI